MTAAALSLSGITCTFISRDDRSQRYTAVRDVSLDIAPGEFVSVVGPTGCGKSTLLNVGAGLLEPSSGSVTVFGEPLSGINRRAGYMFQSEALMPWRTALGNVMAGLEFRGVPEMEARRQAEEWLKRVGLGGFGGAPGGDFLDDGVEIGQLPREGGDLGALGGFQQGAQLLGPAGELVEAEGEAGMAHDGKATMAGACQGGEGWARTGPKRSGHRVS